MNRIKKGDEVIVIAGKDKGRRGTVLRVNELDDQVLIEGINVVKKHQKPNPNSGVQSMQSPRHREANTEGPTALGVHMSKIPCHTQCKARWQTAARCRP